MEHTIETLEIDNLSGQKKIVHWLIPKTLPFNNFLKLIEDKEKKKNVIIAIEENAFNSFFINEKKSMQLN